jgi:hypothetical protein
MSLRRAAVSLAILLLLPGVESSAQSLGTFRWQLQPFCNVFTVNVVQQGGVYTLNGTDDRCGAGNQAGSAVGVAYLTPTGLVGFGLSTVLPNGTPVHTEATINISSLNGTWRDSAGNSGSLVFTPGPPLAGSPRPIPSGGVAPASITNIQIATNAVGTENIIDASITTADLAAPPRSAFSQGDGLVRALTDSPVAVRAITITAPAAGRIIVNAHGLFEFSPASVDYSSCGIFQPTEMYDAQLATVALEGTEAGMRYLPFAVTRGFDVGPGAHTFNLMCLAHAGTSAVWYPAIPAIYTP